MVRPVAKTVNPASSKLAAMPLPTPRLAPVTTAVSLRFSIAALVFVF
jgi:hypothetical protein